LNSCQTQDIGFDISNVDRALTYDNGLPTVQNQTGLEVVFRWFTLSLLPLLSCCYHTYFKRGTSLDGRQSL